MTLMNQWIGYLHDVEDMWEDLLADFAQMCA